MGAGLYPAFSPGSNCTATGDRNEKGGREKPNMSGWLCASPRAPGPGEGVLTDQGGKGPAGTPAVTEAGEAGLV